MSNENSINIVKLLFSYTLDTITCNECKQEFVLLSVFRGIDDFTGEENVSITPQTKTDYCPYCGTKNKKEVEEVI